MKHQQGEQEALAHELFTAAQLAPGEGIEDAVGRLAALVEAQQSEVASSSIFDGVIPAAIRSYLRKCSSGGMSKKHIDIVQINVDEAERLDYFKLAIAEAIIASRVAAPQPAPVAPAVQQAVNQPAPDEIINMAREQGLPETEIEGVFRVNADDLCRVAAAILAARTPADSATAPAGGVVAYLDIGAGGYLDLGTDLSDEALSRLPKGRHALVIAGTYGIDGYTAASTPQSAPAGVLEDAARWHWMAEYIVGTRTELDDELIACPTVDELRKLVDADLAARKQGGV